MDDFFFAVGKWSWRVEMVDLGGVKCAVVYLNDACICMYMYHIKLTVKV